MSEAPAFKGCRAGLSRFEERENAQKDKRVLDNWTAEEEVSTFREGAGPTAPPPTVQRGPAQPGQRGDSEEKTSLQDQIKSRRKTPII